MKYLLSTSEQKNSRYIYFGIESGNNFEQKNVAPQSEETEMSDNDYQKLLTYYEQNPDALQQLIDNDSDQTEDYDALVMQELNIASGGGGGASCRRARRNSLFSKSNARKTRGSFKPKTRGRAKTKKSKKKFFKLNNGKGGYL